MIKINDKDNFVSLSDKNSYGIKRQYQRWPIENVIALCEGFSEDVFFALKKTKGGKVLEDEIRNPKEFIQINEKEFLTVEKNNTFLHRHIDENQSYVKETMEVQYYQYVANAAVWLLQGLEKSKIYNGATEQVLEGQFTEIQETFLGDTAYLIATKQIEVHSSLETIYVIIEEKSLRPLRVCSKKIGNIDINIIPEKTKEEMLAACEEDVRKMLQEQVMLNRTNK